MRKSIEELNKLSTKIFYDITKQNVKDFMVLGIEKHWIIVMMLICKNYMMNIKIFWD